MVDALADYHARGRYGFTPPGHRQGRGADPRTRAAIGEDAFRSDMLATGGLDDRKSSHGYLSKAEELMADAPPGIPVIIPGERLTAALLDYLASGLAAGMHLPDPADPNLRTIRVVARS